MEPDNPYTYLEGYRLYDAGGTEVGEVERTVYDAPADVLKYLVVDDRPIPAEDSKVEAERGIVRVPYDRETIESAPILKEVSGEFDRSLREHYGISG